jgi:hypothetical protein
MTYKKYFYTLIINLFLFGLISVYASGSAVSPDRKSKISVPMQDTLSWSASYMKKIFNGSGEWFMTNEAFQKSIKGVIDYAENDPIDTVIVQMNKLLKNDSIPHLFSRRVENIPNKRRVAGYLTSDEVDQQVEIYRKAVADSVSKTFIQVPDFYLNEGLSKAPLLPLGDSMQLLTDTDKTMPLAFKNRFNKGWGDIKLPSNVTPAEIDTLKLKLFIWIRQSYNDSIIFHQRDSLIQLFRENFIGQLSADAASKKRDFLKAKNRELLTSFNEMEMAKVNDSIRLALQYLTNRAAYDSTLVTITNLSGEQAKAWTANHPMTAMRIFLKNEQNDSLSVILYNNGKGGLRMIIDDGVKFIRFKESQKKEITFDPKKPDSKLKKVLFRQIDPLPWRLLGTGAVGFTQSTLSNWAKGGESSLSMLFIGRYTANYSKRHLKWENAAEFRIGFFSSKTRGLEKNEDKLEFQSRVGYTAFKKWYYSAESNFRTQIARGYKFPDKVNPISTFMAPGYLTFSLGMDFKPNKNFSLFLSPLTSKSTFVRDTVLIKASNFGLERGQKKLWEPGAIAKVNWHYAVIENVVYDTRAEIFNNYRFPFQKFYLDWEQVLVMQVTQHISTRLMTQIIYDYNVMFPVTDDNGKVIDKKAKWQFRELFTVGFNYKF